MYKLSVNVVWEKQLLFGHISADKAKELPSLLLTQVINDYITQNYILTVVCKDHSISISQVNISNTFYSHFASTYLPKLSSPTLITKHIFIQPSLSNIFPNHQSGYISRCSTYFSTLHFIHFLKSTQDSMPLLLDSEKAYPLALILFIFMPLLCKLKANKIEVQSHCDDLAVITMEESLNTIHNVFMMYEISSSALLNTTKSFLITYKPLPQAPFPTSKSSQWYLSFYLTHQRCFNLPPNLINKCIKLFSKSKSSL
mgnify:CR=1 FL=1